MGSKILFEEEKAFILKNDIAIDVRPSRISDVRALQEIFYRLPPDDVYTRFFQRLEIAVGLKS
jgi:hypothetical protein